MSTLSQIIADVEAEWSQIETTLESDVEAIGNVLEPFLVQLLPSQFAILIQVVADNIAELVTNPGAAMTAILTDLESKELAWWKALEAQVQTNIVQAVTAMAVAGQPATPPAAS